MEEEKEIMEEREDRTGGMTGEAILEFLPTDITDSMNESLTN